MSEIHRARAVLLGLDNPNLKHVWVESCRKNRKTGKYDLVLRTSDSLDLDDVKAAAEVLAGNSGPLSSGFEERSADCGGGSSYIEFVVEGCTL